MAVLPEEREMRSHWQVVADRIFKQAPADEVSHRVDLALFYDGELDLTAMRA